MKYPSLIIFVLFLFITNKSFCIEETLTGKYTFNDGFTGDFESDLEISFNIDLEYNLDEQGQRKYKGFSGRFRGYMDGACNQLSLLFNRGICQGKVSISTTLPGNEFLTSLIISGNLEIDTGPSFSSGLLLYEETEDLFNNESCNGKKINNCFYNSSRSEGTDCLTLSEELMCIGSEFQIDLFCDEGHEIVARSFLNDSNNLDYEFPLEEVFIIHDVTLSKTFDHNTKVGDVYSIRISDVDTPVLCEGIDFFNDVMEPSEKSEITNTCQGEVNSLECDRIVRQSIKKTFQKMDNNSFSDSSRLKNYFNPGDISSEKSQKLHAKNSYIDFQNKRISRQQYSDVLEDKTTFKLDPSSNGQVITSVINSSCHQSCSEIASSASPKFSNTFSSFGELKSECSRDMAPHRVCFLEEIIPICSSVTCSSEITYPMGVAGTQIKISGSPSTGRDIDNIDGIVTALKEKGIKIYEYPADSDFYLNDFFSGGSLFEELLQQTQGTGIKIIAGLNELHLLSTDKSFWLKLARPECYSGEATYEECFSAWNISAQKGMLKAHQMAFYELSKLSREYPHLLGAAINDFGLYLCSVDLVKLTEKSTACYNGNDLLELKSSIVSDRRGEFLFLPHLSLKKQIPENIYPGHQIGKIYGHPFNVGEKVQINFKYDKARILSLDPTLSTQLSFSWSDYFDDTFYSNCQDTISRQVYVDSELIYDKDIHVNDWVEHEFLDISDHIDPFSSEYINIDIGISYYKERSECNMRSILAGINVWDLKLSKGAYNFHPRSTEPVLPIRSDGSEEKFQFYAQSNEDFLFGGYFDGVLAGVSANFSNGIYPYNRDFYVNSLNQIKKSKITYAWDKVFILNKMYKYNEGEKATTSHVPIVNDQLSQNKFHSDGTILFEYPLPLVLSENGIFSQKEGGVWDRLLRFPGHTNGYNGFYQELKSNVTYTGVVKLEIKDNDDDPNNGKLFKKIYSPSLGKVFYLDDTGYSPGEYPGHECGGSADRLSDVVITCPGKDDDANCQMTCNTTSEREYIEIDFGSSVGDLAISLEVGSGVKNTIGEVTIDFPTESAAKIEDFTTFSSSLDRDGESEYLFDNLVFP